MQNKGSGGWAGLQDERGEAEPGSGCAQTAGSRRSAGSFLRIVRPIRLVQSFDITTITMMRFGWEQTARRPRITRRWWAPPGTQDEENQQL
jgi:hypothetical protein